ncbi:hypothetical protein L6R52_37730, partial [Myxococcota bacterium]|nr:hypothetical protein [Myxococcota bacterium]
GVRAESVSPWLWAVMFFVAALYGYLSLRYQMHDEHAIFGHKSMVEQLRYGEYPPYPPPFPELDARYHYGFDVLAGVLARALGLSSDLAIDVTTVALALWMSWAAAALVIDAGAARSAPFAAFVIHFGAGLSAFMLGGVEGRHPRCLVQYHHPTCGVELFPTQLLNVFQHPVSLGVPLMLCVVLVAPRLVLGQGALAALASGASPERGSAEDADGVAPRRAVKALAVVLLAGLSLGQFVYYALAALALVAAVPVWLVVRDRWSSNGSRWARWRPAIVRVLVVLALAHALAFLAGGMLTPTDALDPGLLVRRSRLGFPPGVNLASVGWHHAANLGLAFVLLPAIVAVGLRRVRPTTVQLFAFAMGGMLVPHLFEYVRSWDIVKFPSAASYALTMLYVIVLDAIMPSTLAGVWLRRTGRVLVTGTGVLTAVLVTFPLRGELRLYELGAFEPDPLVAQVVSWLRGNGYQREELVLAQGNVAQQLSVFGGLSVVGEDGDLFTQGYKQSLLNEKRRLANDARSTMSADALAKLGVRWLVFSDEELANLGGRARRVLEGGERGIAVVATFDDPSSPQRRRRIWRVPEPAPPRAE